MALSWGQFGNRLKDDARLKGIPLIGQFELTSRCNLSCKMCYVSSSVCDKDSLQKEHSAKEWIQLAREARDAGMLYLLLTGGEVFIFPQFRELYDELCNMGFILQIYTNGTLITPEIAEWLGKKPPSKVGITLYGASPETYEKVCGASLHFNKVIEGIKLLKQQNILVELKTTVINENASDFEEIAKLAETLGVELKIVNYISPRRDGLGTCPEEVRLSPKELSQYEHNANMYFVKRELDKINNEVYQKPDIPGNYEPVESNKEVTECDNNHAFQCTAGSCAFWITSDGRMTPCGLISTPVTFPFKDGFLNCWNQLVSMCSSVPVCLECSTCSLKEYCITCPARLKNETGEFDKPAPYLCKHAENTKLLESMEVAS
jgi:MoaA/NifB/PqqE/SkfB family radical SAM enzyme